MLPTYHNRTNATTTSSNESVNRPASRLLKSQENSCQNCQLYVFISIIVTLIILILVVVIFVITRYGNDDNVNFEEGLKYNERFRNEYNDRNQREKYETRIKELESIISEQNTQKQKLENDRFSLQQLEYQQKQSIKKFEERITECSKQLDNQVRNFNLANERNVELDNQLKSRISELQKCRKTNQDLQALKSNKEEVNSQTHPVLDAQNIQHSKPESEPEPQQNQQTPQPHIHQTKPIFDRNKVLESKEVKRDIIVKEFLHVQNAYKKFAQGKDDLHPISKRGGDSMRMSTMMIDSLDTLLIMNLDNEYKECRDQLEAGNLKFGNQTSVSLFEATIRVVGGLLSAYYLNPSDRFLLLMAQDLVNNMKIAFESPTGIPYGNLNMVNKHSSNPGQSGGSSTISEVLSIQLEFQYLSYISDNSLYSSLVNRATESILNVPRHQYGLLPQYIDPKTGQFNSEIFSMGALIDSSYEIWLKQWIMSSGKSEYQNVLKAYFESVDAMQKHLVKYSKATNLTYLAEINNGIVTHKMETISCFVPGMLALGSTLSNNPKAGEHLKLAKELARTCYELHDLTKTGLAAESYLFEDDKTLSTNNEPTKQTKRDHIQIIDENGKLRPQIFESLYILQEVTQDETYREQAQKIFESMRKSARVENGYASLNNVDDSSKREDKNYFIDNTEGYILSETFKYMYLMFADTSSIPKASLKKSVFSTQAHLFPIFNI